MNYTVEKIHNIILGYILEQGESLWEEIDSVFDGNQEHYLSFLESHNYITPKQKENWLKLYVKYQNEEDFTNIEAMTYMSLEEFAYDMAEDYPEMLDDSGAINRKKANELGLINVPVFIDTQDVEKFNNIYWTDVLKVIAEYLFENLDIYKEFLDETDKLVRYYMDGDYSYDIVKDFYLQV